MKVFRTYPVNSVDTVTPRGAGNTEPSPSGNGREGVTTRESLQPTGHGDNAHSTEAIRKRSAGRPTGLTTEGDEIVCSHAKS
jgi:hypothetical protein